MSNFIILNNQVIEGLEIGSIFDSEKYDIFKGVTFSIDQKFAEKHLSNFKETTIVVGIQDSDVQERGLSLEQKQIKQLVDNTKILSSGLPIKMFENFSRSIQDRILEDSYQLRIPLSKTIHTKMYLLKNSESGDTRLIIGSANLSNQAFSNTTPQLELLEIRDNSELFSEYENYFDTEIISETVDFFGNSVRKKAKSKAQKEETNVTITFTPKEFGELKVNRISEQFDQIKESVSSGKIEQTVIDELKEEAKIVDVRSKELKQEFDDFPEERVDDTNKTNITMWKRLYTAMPELFKKISDDETNQDIYILKLSDLDHNFQKDNMYSKEKKPSSVYSEALDNRVLASTRTKADLFIEFYVNQFHDWIGIPEVNSEKAEAVINSVESQTKQETSNKGFFGRLFGK